MIKLLLARLYQTLNLRAHSDRYVLSKKFFEVYLTFFLKILEIFFLYEVGFEEMKKGRLQNFVLDTLEA